MQLVNNGDTLIVQSFYQNIQQHLKSSIRNITLGAIKSPSESSGYPLESQLSRNSASKNFSVKIKCEVISLG